MNEYQLEKCYLLWKVWIYENFYCIHNEPGISKLELTQIYKKWLVVNMMRLKIKCYITHICILILLYSLALFRNHFLFSLPTSRKNQHKNDSNYFHRKSNQMGLKQEFSTYSILYVSFSNKFCGTFISLFLPQKNKTIDHHFGIIIINKTMLLVGFSNEVSLSWCDVLLSQRELT